LLERDRSLRATANGRSSGKRAARKAPADDTDARA
jgi:hypothetical protein